VSSPNTVLNGVLDALAGSHLIAASRAKLVAPLCQEQTHGPQQFP
jgi:hypothetical protein